MDPNGHIFDVEEERKRLQAELIDPAEAEAKLSEAQARLDGYLRGRAESDAPKRERPNSDLTRRRSDA